MKLNLLVLIIIIAIIFACSPRRGIPYTEPLTIEDPDVRQGMILFNEYCNTCHPQGTAGLGPALNNKPLPGFAIRFQIRNGVGAMPGFSEDVISDAEAKQIVAYMKELRQLDEE